MVYIHRDVEDGAFMQWYNSNKNCVGFKKALVVYGARQVGKTTTINHFANEHFQNVYYFNLKEDDFAFGTLKNAVYRDNYDFMYNLMQILTNGNFIDDINSVIIFDEVQSVPEVYSHLRNFTRILKSYIILTGSYLGMHAFKPDFIPVGDIRHIYMTGFTFKEFLRITGYEYYIDKINENIKLCTSFTYEEHNELFGIFNTYIKIGGYPSVVLDYIDDFNDDTLFFDLEDLVNLFCDESMKYLENVDDKIILKDVLYHIPKVILKRENITSKVSKVTELINETDKLHNKITSKDVRNIISWLIETHMFTQSYRCADLEFNFFSGEGRVYLRDTGLARYLLGNTDTATGIITEGYILTVLENIISINRGKTPERVLFVESPGLEVDFYAHTTYGKTAIEVKTGSNMKNKGSVDLLKNKKIDFIIRTGMSNLGREGNILTVPLYAFSFLDLRISDNVRLGFDKMDSDFMKEFKEKQKNNYYIKPMKFFE